MTKAANYTPAELVKLAVGAAPGLSSPAPWKAPAATGSKPVAPLSAPSARQPNNPSIGGAFLGGLGQGAKNIGSSVMNFFPAMAHFAVPTAAGALAQASPHPETRAMGQEWLQHGMAGAKDMAGNVKKFLGVNNTTPQNVAQHQQAVQQKYFSNPKDNDLSTLYTNANRTADVAAQTIPAALTGQAAVAGASKIPALAQAGNAVKATIEGNRVLDPLLRTTSVATGMPLHPAALPGGNLSGLAGASQMAQYMGPGLATVGTGLAARAAGASPETQQQAAQTVNNAAQTVSAFLPAVATDNFIRQNVHQRAPELLDAAALPGAAMQTAALEGVANMTAPSTQPSPEERAYRAYVEQAYPAQTAMNQAARADNTDAMVMQMANDPAMRNRMGHGAVPPEVAKPLMQASGVPEELQQEYADAVSSNAQPQQNAQNVYDAMKSDVTGQMFEQAMTPLSEAQTPEQKAEIEKTVVPQLTEQLKNTVPPEKVQTVQGVAQDPNSPESRKAIEESRSAFAAEQAGGDQSKLQNPEFFGSVMGMWNSLGAPGQMAFMLGVPAALIGLLSGDGLTGLLGGLGIGGLGIAGAASGMFGNDAQAATGKMLGDMGNFLGFIPDEARDASNLMPGSDASKKFEAEVAKAFETQGPEAAQKLIDAQTAKFQPLEQMHKTNPAFAHSYLMGMNNGPKTPEEAQKLYDQLNAQVAQARDPNFLRTKATDAATQKVQTAQNMVPAWMRVAARLGKDYIPGAQSILPQSVQDTIDAASTDPRVVAEREIAKRYKQGADMNIAQKIAFQQMTQKAARCWAGYEPVPGKAPYSENSCRPKAKKKKKTEKKAEQYSNEPFNPAIGYKHPNPNATLAQQYQYQMSQSASELAKKTKNPKYRFSNMYNMGQQHYGGLPPRPPQVPAAAQQSIGQAGAAAAAMMPQTPKVPVSPPPARPKMPGLSPAKPVPAI